MEGTVTKQLSFVIPLSSYITGAIPQRAKVEFKFNSTIYNLPYFFVANRTKVGESVRFVCYDRMAFTDSRFIVEDTDFDKNDYIDTSTVLQKIQSICGFNSVIYYPSAVSITTLIPKMQKSDVYGKSCRSILEALGKAIVGTWSVDYSDSNQYVAQTSDALIFEGYGHVRKYYNTIVAHAEIEEGLMRDAYTKVVVTDGDKKIFESGTTSDNYTTITINTPYASADLAGNIYTRLQGSTYLPWSCKKAEISGPIGMNSEILFKDGTTRKCNSVIVYPRAYGVYVTFSCNPVTENEFEGIGEISRQIEDCVKSDKIYNNAIMTRYQGLIFTADETDDDGHEVKSKYGFGTYAGGITEYDGAITSKVVPSKAEKNSDGTITISYEDNKKYKYTVEKDASGNITSLKKEDVTET